MDTKFQISEFETVEESVEVFTPEGQGVQADLGNVSRPTLGRPHQTSPDLHLPSILQTNSTGEATSQRVRPGSDPSDVEPGPSGDAGSFRVRSKSAPPVMWAAMRYGRELRRMSDEFDMSYQGLPRPKSASQASELKKANGWTEFFRGMFGPSRRKEDRDKNQKF